MSSWTEFDLNNSVAARRASASGMLSDLERRRLGQYFTPLHVARFIASLSRATGETIRILDPGAGVGSLFAAAVDALCSAKNPPRAIRVTAVEVDQLLHSHLADTIAECEQPCGAIDFDFFGEIVASNYLEVGVDMLAAQMAFDAKEPVEFDIVIANPPYRKINASSLERRRLQQIGIETGNLYSAFLAISALLLREGGELVAITPRSFCNGSYFRPFREMFLRSMRFTRIHVLESRSEAFEDDDVLQENIMFRAVKGGTNKRVKVTSGDVSRDGYSFGREIPYDELVYPCDRDKFIHLPTHRDGAEATLRMHELPCELSDLDMSVSTGRVVDFRAREHLLAEPEAGAVPLIYPVHFTNGGIEWPKNSKKPNAIRIADVTKQLLVPSGYYVLVRRFSAKEERRRIVASVYDPSRYPEVAYVGLENHLNYFHRAGAGLEANVAFGLAGFLNSTFVDKYFRQFSGHTQVNAQDLRKLRFPCTDALRTIGTRVSGQLPAQAELDTIVESTIAVEAT